MNLLFLLACSEEADPVDVGFVVVGVSPEDGAADVVEAHVPELRFSADLDTDACDADRLRLDAVEDDGSVAFSVDAVLTPVDRAAKMQFAHEVPFPAGWTYALSVRGGPDGCLDVAGNEIRPFLSRFFVP